MENLYKFTRKELEDIIKGFTEPSYRSKQIFNWLYKKFCLSFEEMKNIPKDLISKLEENFIILLPEIIEIQKSQDGTQKYLLKLKDNLIIEAVYIPEENRGTVCLSSQVGCPLKCLFCISGNVDFMRNLAVEEIIGQLIVILKAMDRRSKINIVFMGMGEPLLNIDNVIKAFEIMIDQEGLSISRRNITISTAGYVPGIKKLADYKRIPKIAFSLNSASNIIRNFIMPINKKYPIEEVMNSLKLLNVNKRERITIEYVMIKDINDRIVDAKLLAELAKKIPCKINLIPLNENTYIPFEASSKNKIEEFADFLRKNKLTVTIRKSRGKDIDAACGLLKWKSKFI